jgi:phosphomethylpyrimidine synthase
MPSADLERVAAAEGVSCAELAASAARGETIITPSRRGAAPVGVGPAVRAKFACIIGTSSTRPDLDELRRKALAAVESGASVVHNGSAGANFRETTEMLLGLVQIPLAAPQPTGLMAHAQSQGRRLVDLQEKEFVAQIRSDIEAGFEVLPIPLGATKALLRTMQQSRRLMPCCSKCGSLVTAWMLRNDAENPYLSHLDEILHMVAESSTVLSIVAGYRPGAIHDAFDALQLAELRTIEEVVGRAHAAGAQVKVITGGHLPIHKIGPFFAQQRAAMKTPLLAFGPQVTDTSVGLDHISSAMGQIQALVSGADMIFTMTRAEHIGMPSVDETREGCHVASMVCHSANLARGFDQHRDDELSAARERMDWGKQAEFAAADTVKARLLASARSSQCDVCGDFCAIKTMRLCRTNGS